MSSRVAEVLTTWALLLQKAFSTWWDQVTSIEGAIAALVRVLLFVHQPIAKRVDKLMVYGQTLPKKYSLMVLALWMAWIVMMTAHDELKARSGAPIQAQATPERIIERVDPNPALQTRISELDRQRVIDAATIERLQAAGEEKDTLIETLRQQLDQRGRIANMRRRLTDISMKGAELKGLCRTTDPTQYMLMFGKWRQSAIDALNEAGFNDDAARVERSQLPPGIRVTTPNCEPNSTNTKTALGFTGLLFLLDDISKNLGR